VHGVSGAGPDEMLDRPLVFRVTGDRSAGFYRPRPEYGNTTGPGGAMLEAYRWGGLTVATATRALSLAFLLPFLLSNVAVWMRPATPGARRPVTVLCRLLAATLTVSYVLFFVGIWLDLIGWQCVPYVRCVEDRQSLSWMSDLPTGPRLALLALVPIAVISLVWWLGSRSWCSYEAFRSGAADSGGDRLDAVGWWNGMPLVGRLRSIHVAVAFAGVNGSVLAVFVPRDSSIAGLTLLGTTVALLATCLVLLCLPALDELGVAGGWMETATRTVRGIACGITVLTLVFVGTQRVDWREAGALPWYGATDAWVLLTQATLLALLGAVLWHQRNQRHSGALLGGAGPLVLAAAAVGLTAILSSVVTLQFADVLDRGAVPDPTRPMVAGVPPLQPSDASRWVQPASLIGVLVAMLIAACWSTVTLARRRRAAATVTARDFPDPPATAQSRMREVRDSILKARNTERRVPPLVALVTLVALGLPESALALAGLAPADLTAWLNGAHVASALAAVWAYVGGVLLVVLMVAGLLAYRSGGLRSLVGVLWDLCTFWPRAAHPFVPTCYAERAVPELGRRIRFLAEQGDAVVLSGHSHGSVLLAATVLQLPPATRRRVALLTYGSPLRRLYARLFPAYLGDDVLREVGDRVGWRWLNLWRDTDPIGGSVFSPHRFGERPSVEGPAAAVDWRLRDPRGVALEPQHTLPPPIDAHWPYHSDERFDAAVRELVRRTQGLPQGSAR
jgi:hypothetical protein